jgi:dienelactone hydrolase
MRTVTDKRTAIEPREIVIDTGNDQPIRTDLWSVHPRQALPLVIVCHGFLGYKRWGFFPFLSEQIAAAGTHVMTISFSMNGVDEETGIITRPDEFARNTVGREIEDLRRMCGLVRAGALPFQVRSATWGLFGHSRGGAVAMLVSPEFSEIRTVVTWSTLSRFDRYTDRRKVQWKREGTLVFKDDRSAVPLHLDYSYYEDIARNRERYDLRRSAAALEVPHLMVHGERDAAVTLTETQKLLEVPRQADRCLEVIRGCGHTFGVTHPLHQVPLALERAVALTVAWFRNRLG